MGVYMFIGGLALFVLGMEFMCLISGFVTKYEAFKAEAEDRMRNLETSIQEMKSEMRALSAKADRALIEKPFAEASFRGKHESKKETITEAYIKGQKLCINIYAEAPDMRKVFMENGLVCKENCSCCGYKE